MQVFAHLGNGSSSSDSEASVVVQSALVTISTFVFDQWEHTFTNAFAAVVNTCKNSNLQFHTRAPSRIYIDDT